MIVVGLTGSIAMGKTETAKMFRALGIPVFEADACVHRLYEAGGAAVTPVAARFPQAIVNGAVDRGILTQLVLDDPVAMAELEAIVHPLVWRAEREFLAAQEKSGAPLAVLDNPLLFEKGRDQDVDAIVVVSAPADVQRARALARPGMTVKKLDAILARQMPDAEKRRRADFVIDTSQGLEYARAQVEAAVAALRGWHKRVEDARDCS